MKIKKLSLFQFRNYERAEFAPCPGVTVLYGANAQGKTNLLEALVLCCLGRSHRTNKDLDLIRFGQAMARVRAVYEGNEGAQEILVCLSASEGKKKEVRLNQTPMKRIGELMGHINVVLFSPEDLRLIKDGPESRRRFLDMEISQQQPAYFYALQRYQRALTQRNELLKKIADSASGALFSTLAEWDALLAAAGGEIISRRKAFIGRLSEAAKEAHFSLSGGKEELTLRYAAKAQDALELENFLRASRKEDMRRMTTTVGPHRDDLTVLINGRDARLFGSQGQQRTAALSLKLSEIEVMRRDLQRSPILLLDDVMSELDVSRRNMLLSSIGGVQTVITCTDVSDLGGASYEAAYRVEDGALLRE